jgi:hypothetical protein
MQTRSKFQIPRFVCRRISIAWSEDSADRDSPQLTHFVASKSYIIFGNKWNLTEMETKSKMNLIHLNFGKNYGQMNGFSPKNFYTFIFLAITLEKIELYLSTI